jgi:penicillin amidase
VRPELNAWLPVPGWSGDYEWQGAVPFEELVRSRNPSTGYIVTANNRIAGDDYEHYIALHYSPDYRARRIKDRLEKLDGATVEDMGAVHTEAVSIPAQIYTALLGKITPADKVASQALEKLKDWDGKMAANSIAPTVYSAMRLSLERTLLRHTLAGLADDALSAAGRGAPMHVAQLHSRFATAAQNGDTSLLPPDTDWNTAVAMALAEGVAFLQQTYGEDMSAWEWGKVHTTKPQHTLSVAFPEAASLLDPPTVPMSGDGDTPHSASYAASEPFDVTGTSVARYVFDLEDWSRSRWITPLGSSGHPGSPHYADQIQTWGARELVPMLYDWDRIEAQAESRRELDVGS